MIKIGAATVVQTTRRFKVELTGKSLRCLLLRAGHQIPPQAKVTFKVPGGGDWSNMTIDIDAEHPVEVAWEITDVETSP